MLKRLEKMFKIFSAIKFVKSAKSLVMGSGQNFLTRVGSIFLWLGSGRVRSAIYSLGLNLENFP